MEQKIDLIGSFATDWIRYSDYTVTEDAQGHSYLTPAVEADFSMYNPFNVAEELLADIMELGRLAEDSSTDEKNSALLIFTRKYGLLGLINASVYNRNIFGESHLMFVENNFVTKEQNMEPEKYIKLFTPFAGEEDLVLKKYTNKLNKVTLDLKKADDSPKFYGKRPIVMDLIFSRFYAERTEWILNFAKMLVAHFSQLLTYRNRSGYLTQDVTILAGQFHAEKIGFTINQLDKTTIAWQFDSLKTAVETIYAFAVTDEKRMLSTCTHCGKIFIGKSTREKYCTPVCRNRANVQKSRGKK